MLARDIQNDAPKQLHFMETISSKKKSIVQDSSRCRAACTEVALLKKCKGRPTLDLACGLRVCEFASFFKVKEYTLRGVTHTAIQRGVCGF